jgi:hypothetical protein
MLLMAFSSCNSPEFSREDPQGIYKLGRDIDFSLCGKQLTSNSLPPIKFEIAQGEHGSSVVLDHRIDLTSTPEGIKLSVLSNTKTFMPIIQEGNNTAFLFVDPKDQTPVLAKRVGKCP